MNMRDCYGDEFDVRGFLDFCRSYVTISVFVLFL
jgi:hypothetical protein